MTHEWYSIGFAGSYGASRFLAAMTTKLGDNCALRYQNLTAGGVQVKVEEDTTWDTETYHWKLEAVACLALEGDGLLTAVSGPGADRETSYYYFSGQRVAMRQDDTLYSVIGDPLGTTSAIFDAGGTLHSQSRHYPYGTERWATGAVPTDYRFTGQRYNNSIELTLMGARWEDGALGIWLSPDIIGPIPANPTSLNRYAYVRGSPLGYEDPTGDVPRRPPMIDGLYVPRYEGPVRPNPRAAPHLAADQSLPPHAELPNLSIQPSDLYEVYEDLVAASVRYESDELFNVLKLSGISPYMRTRPNAGTVIHGLRPGSWRVNDPRILLRTAPSTVPGVGDAVGAAVIVGQNVGSYAWGADKGSTG